MDVNKYIYGHCVSPVKVKMWDAYLQQYVVRELPCGKCLHCRNTHINEWCTRLIAQKKYSKFCYYVSLDYAPFDEASPVAMQLAKETAACYHDINKYHKYALHPLVLCKNHLQDFFKRLRKNTNIKLQYFSCGEYGMHANGHGFGRPHFHNIIFCNSPISVHDFEDAWTINGYKIGHVDFEDMTPYKLGDSNNIKCFKYVCKYLQKWDFNFENLATIDFHRAYFKSLQYVLTKTDTLFPELVPVEDTKSLELLWCEYTAKYAPFVVCSRRPAIGYEYFKDNLERFKEQDFRLFGLPKECTTFPRYYVRRTKEALFDFRSIGEISQKPTSSSRMGFIFKILRTLYDSRVSVDNWSETPKYFTRVYKSEGGELCVNSNVLSSHIKCSTLSFYDSKNNFMYQFDGYGYKVWCKMNNNFVLFDYMDIIDVLYNIAPSWDRYRNSVLSPAYQMRELKEKELNESICAMFKPTADKTSYDLFQEKVYAIYESELASNYKTKLLMQNSKTEL